MKRAIPFRYHSSRQTSSGARVALQRCPILQMSKSSLSVACHFYHVNVQSARRGCSFSPPQVFNLSAPRCSTPPTYAIGEEVQIRLTHAMVEVFFGGSRVAAHQRKAITLREPVVNLEHMPPAHRKYLTYNADDFTVWAQEIGSNTAEVVRFFLTSGNAPEQGYKSCASLLKLAERHSNSRLENACMQVLACSSSPSIRNIGAFLRSSKHATEAATKEDSQNRYGITRGAGYFGKGGDAK